MAAMNKPTYGAIKAHSPHKPTLVFVSSRRQTRLTALELLALAAADDSPAKPQFLGDGVTLQEAAGWGAQAVDPALAHCLPHGVAMHHAGLPDGDRQLVEALFAGQKVRVLVCTATLAWGVNLPAHLVVVKGTEYYDGATRRYVDFPITDVLQMMGRAGRPQFDTSGCAVILAHEPKKAFYKKFLYEPFPVESSLHLPGVLADHLNAEVATGTVACIQDGLDFLSWSYLFRRVSANPSFYGCAGSDDASVDAFLSDLVLEALQSLQEAGCVEVVEGDTGGGEEESIFGDDGDADKAEAAPRNPGWKAGAEKRHGAGQQQQQQPLLTKRLAGTPIGRIIGQYYLRHRSAAVLADFASGAGSQSRDVRGALAAVCSCAEFDELPVRHNEELSNATLADAIASAGGWPPLSAAMDDPHVKTQLLLQAHLLGLSMPVSDYVTDLRSAMDNAPRVVQAAVEVAVQRGNAAAALAAMRLAQCLAQGAHPDSTKGKGKKVPQPRGAPVALDAQVSGEQLRVTATVATALAMAPGVTRHKGSSPGTSWWLCALDATSGRLWAVKRVSLDARRRGAATAVALALGPEAVGAGSTLEVHLVSDSLHGVDAVTKV
jgi:activating signal cointegrator complex subunit 3